MATLACPVAHDRNEARFFFAMACLMAITVFAGFGFNVVVGRSNFGLPLIYHVHAFVFSGWTLLYVLQTSLIFRGNLALHRRLGWLSVFFIPAIVVMGFVMTFRAVQTTGGPPFFAVNSFLLGSFPLLLGFAGLASWAVAVRRNTGWHRRLMFCAMALLTGPAISRMMPMPLFIPWSLWVSTMMPAIFPLIGMAADLRLEGKIHPAWFVGSAILLSVPIVGDLLAYSPLGYSFTEWVIARTPAAERPMDAFWPPM